MSQSLVTFGLALVLGLVLSRLSLRSLSWLQSRERKAGKERIHKLFPKPRRPLGGGLAMMVAATVAGLLIPLFWGRLPAPTAVWAVLAGWGFALIGLTDDLRKVSGRGLREKPKLALQVAIALAFGWLLWELKLFRTVWVPFYPTPVNLGLWHIPFAAIVMLATANAVNLSDGVDGLAGGAAVITLLGLVGVGLVQPGHSVEGAAWPFLGAIVGFLAYNLPPGRLLMGDTGALAIGAVIATLATFAGVEVWLLPLAAPFVINAASVLLQLGMVRGLWRIIRPLRHRTTETPRPFLCTPLHHHFQWLGWGDWKVLGLFWGLGAVEAAWTLVALGSGLLWLVALGLEGCFLLAAASQKVLRAQYFLGSLPRAGQPSLLGLYRGMPMQILGLPLYQVHHETSVTEDMLVGATAESILWRPISEVEAHVVLGKIYADQKLLDEAVREWEQVPVRNLLLRPTVVLRLARIYYGRDRLLEAIKLWEELPSSRLEEMPNVREVVRSAKLRLADLASKSHRQSMRILGHASSQQGSAAPLPPRPVDPARLESYLIAARRWNQELLSLLLYERDKLRGKAADPQAVRARRELMRETRAAVMARIREVDEGLGQLARTTAPTGQPAAPVGHAPSVPPATPAESPPATTPLLA
jgi:phospho-N-acetylmuramoyl-pentapeptide-transferase